MSDFEIICIEDEPEVLETLVKLVESTEFQTKGFTSPQEALSYITQNKHRIVMILSDYRMDEMDGFELKRKLNSSCKDIPFVVITGFWSAELSSLAMEIGIEAFLQKPFDPTTLNELISKFASTRKEMLEEEREMVQGFLEETMPMLDEIEALILELEESDNKEQPLAVYFRLLHTIKGTAACVGLVQLGSYTHKYEDFIGELRQGRVAVNTKSINVLLAGLDDLKSFFQAVESQGNDADLVITDKIEKFHNFNDENSQSEVNQQVVSTSEDKKIIKQEEVKSDDDKMTVSMGLLNDFMEESGELTVIRNSILKTVKKIEGRYRGDEDIEQLNQLLSGMYSVTSNIQGKITEMRKVPLKNTFRPYKRLVRDLTKKLGKEVELVIEGEDLLVDNILAKLFSNTMIHIIRNSLDHGIETPADRQKKGKDACGRLEIRAFEEGEDIILKVIDDGKGIDPAIIKSLAIKKGLYSEEEIATLNPTQIINIIFESGFSTAELVSDLSGRGVGMDMVRGSFLDMGGEVYVQSETNKGSEFTLKVPIPKSVLIINTLSVCSNGKVMLFHMDEVAEVLRFEAENKTTRIYELNGKKLLDHNQEMIELVPLKQIFHCDELESDLLNIVILRSQGRKFGVIVDEIFEFEEVVLRKITSQIHSHQLYHGASLVGAGEVAMILSAAGLAQRVGIQIENEPDKLIERLADTKEDVAIDEYMLFESFEGESLCVNLEQVERLEKIVVNNIERVGDNAIVRYNNANLPLIDPGFCLGLSDIHKLGPEELADRERLDVIVVNHDGKRLGICVQELGEIKRTHQKLDINTVDILGLAGSLFLEGKTICLVDIAFLVAQSSKKREIEKNLSFQIPDAA